MTLSIHADYDNAILNPANSTQPQTYFNKDLELWDRAIHEFYNHLAVIYTLIPTTAVSD